MTDFSGRWVGSIVGTNVATFTLVLQQTGGTILGDLSLSEVALGVATFKVEGTAGDGVGTFRLTPGTAAPGTGLSDGVVRAALQTDGSLAGIWEMESRTF